jgi:hypothetical protein
MPKPRQSLALTMPQVGVYATRDRVVITVGFPSGDWMKVLDPHASEHYMNGRSPKKALKHAVVDAARLGAPTTPWPAAEIRYKFFFPDMIHRDESNMVQRMKSIVDALQPERIFRGKLQPGAGIIAGDHWQVLHTAGIECSVDRANPRIEIVLERRQA